MGETASAVQIAEELLSTEQNLSAQMRWTCFYNLTDLHCSLGNLKVAENYRVKACACTRRCKSLKTKQWMSDVLHAQEGVLFYHAGAYENAKQRLLECGWDGEETAQTLCTQVFHAYWAGLIFLETGDKKLAMEKLWFVAEHGNQLYITARAKEMIE